MGDDVLIARILTLRGREPFVLERRISSYDDISVGTMSFPFFGQMEFGTTSNTFEELENLTEDAELRDMFLIGSDETQLSSFIEPQIAPLFGFNGFHFVGRSSDDFVNRMNLHPSLGRFYNSLLSKEAEGVAQFFNIPQRFRDCQEIRTENVLYPGPHGVTHFDDSITLPKLEIGYCGWNEGNDLEAARTAVSQNLLGRKEMHDNEYLVRLSIYRSAMSTIMTETWERIVTQSEVTEHHEVVYWNEDTCDTLPMINRRLDHKGSWLEVSGDVQWPSGSTFGAVYQVVPSSMMSDSEAIWRNSTDSDSCVTNGVTRSDIEVPWQLSGSAAVLSVCGTGTSWTYKFRLGLRVPLPENVASIVTETVINNHLPPPILLGPVPEGSMAWGEGNVLSFLADTIHFPVTPSIGFLHYRQVMHRNGGQLLNAPVSASGPTVETFQQLAAPDPRRSSILLYKCHILLFITFPFLHIVGLLWIVLNSTSPRVNAEGPKPIVLKNWERFGLRRRTGHRNTCEREI